MPSARRSSRAPLFLSLVLGSCSRTPYPSEPPPDPSAGESEDAAGLPRFDVSGGEVPVSKSGVPYERFRVEIGDAPVRGRPDAPVTVVMFSDFECPYCAHGHEAVTELSRRYENDIRVVYKAFPLDFHENALLAAMAVKSAQAQGKFWELHDRLFGARELDLARITHHAEAVGLNLARLERDLESLEYGAEVNRDVRQGRRLGVHSTPTFFINGRFVKGAQPVDQLAVLIEQELALAKKWRASGIAADRIYDHAIADGYRRVEYTEPGALDADGVYPVPIDDSPTKGPATAPVTIVVFGDFECPFCSRGNAILQNIEDRYRGKLRVVYKHQPLSFHSHAFLAARATMAAHEQGKFWPFHDALYRLRSKFDEKDLYAIAKQLRLDMNRFKKAMNGTDFDRRIVRDQELALALGVRGTPAYFINGRPLEGARPELHFRLIVEEELERAAAALASGTTPDRLYETLTQKPLD